jgi:small subunit ribosomal protein S16
MLKIRMQRTGRINQPSFRIVVTEHTASPKAGKYVERVGFYNPRSKEKNLMEERIKYWMSVGAQPSGTVHNMLVSAGIVKGKKINVLPKKTVAKKEEPAAEAPASQAAEAAAEAPATTE